MCQNYVYEHSNLPDNKWENTFAQIESKAIPFIKKLIKRINNNYKNNKSIKEYASDISELVECALVFYFRSGALLEEYSFDSDRPNDQKIERMMDNILDENYRKYLSETIKRCYECSIIIDEDNSFLVSDQYISTVALKFKRKFANISNRQIGLVDTMILLPLSSKIYVVFHNGKCPSFIKGGRVNLLNQEEVERINNVIMDNAYHFCVGKNQDELFRQRERTKGVHYPAGSISTRDNGIVESYTMKKEVFFYDEDKEYDLYFMQYVSKYQQKIDGKIGRNDKCICGSGKKYKKCCEKKYETAMQLFRDWQNGKDYVIPGAKTIERPILNYMGRKDSLPEGKIKNIIELSKKNRKGV